jgi:L-amino acid N-acyltransferase YncA/DNA-binding transcriptional ArsR family regulator/precorrin-6B methylase 2
MDSHDAAPLERAVATEYASWFRALADATRVQIVSLLARRGAPMSVGAITAALDVGQSTVSAHLKVLAEVRFVLVERRGTSAYYRINDSCVECFPTAADIVMGRPVPVTADDTGQVRARVLARYGELARAAAAGGQVTGAAPDAFTDGGFGGAGYADVGGLPGGAVRASLGCGNPVAVAALRPGETVLDLGSGGGIDVLLSARRVGPAGKVYGLDGAPEMVELARANAAAAGADNAEFLLGDIEDVPLPDGQVDVVISNCVINLSADKPRVLAEAFRVLRPGGRLGVSDIIADDDADPAQRAAAEQRTGCTTGTVTASQYRQHLVAAGFTQITITPTAATAGILRSANISAVRPAAPPRVLIRPMVAADAHQVLAIYQAGLNTGQASFETTAPDWKAFDAGKLPLHRYVAVAAATGHVLGWAAASAVSGRSVYAGVIEHSVYVDLASPRRGIGGALLAALIGSTEAAGIWTIQSSVFPENTASLRLHQKAGFRVVGTREQIGCHHGQWRDTILLERHSATAGTNSGASWSAPPDDSGSRAN